MCRSEINRAARVLSQRRLAILSTLIVFAGCRWSEPGEWQSQHPKPPSSQPSTQPSGAVEFRAEVVSVIPITQYSGRLRPVSNDPRYAATARLLDDVAELSCKQGETICLGLHSPIRTFGSNDVAGRVFRFRIFGSEQQYYHVQAESDHEGDHTRRTAQPAPQVFHLPGMDVVRLAELLRSAIRGDKSGARDMIVVADSEAESIRVSRATTAQLRVIEEMIAEWRTATFIDPYIEFIRLQHADARPVAKKLAEFLKTEGGFEHVTVGCDARTNRLIVVGAGPEGMRPIERYVAELDTPVAPKSGPIPIVYHVRFDHPPLSDSQAQDLLKRAQPLCPQGQKVWFIYVTANWKISGGRKPTATVYFTPGEETKRLRKGKFAFGVLTRAELEALRSEHGGRIGREALQQAREYWQVSLQDEPFAKKVEVPDVALLPFPKPIGFTEKEVIEIVDFVRTNPEHPERHGVFDGSQPILSITRRDDVIEVKTGTIEGMLAGSGQLLTCKRSDDGTFEVLSIGMWVS